MKSASLATINLNELTLLASALLSVTTTLVIASAIAASVDNAATEANFLLPALTKSQPFLLLLKFSTDHTSPSQVTFQVSV